MRIIQLALIGLFACAATQAGELLPPKDKMTKAQGILANSVPLKKIDSDKGLEKLTGFPNKPGNAAAHYAKLEELFKEDRESPDKFNIKKRSKGIKEIFKAVMIKDCRMSPEYYPAMTEGTVKRPDMIVYLAYARALLDLAKELEQRGDFKGAGAVYRSALIFGWHLTQTPHSLLTEVLGLRIKAQASLEYSRFLQRKLDMKRCDAAQEYADYLAKAQTAINRKLNFFLGNTMAFNSLYSAIRIATEDESPAWRREAIMRLGVYRFGAPGSSGEIIFKDPKRQKDAEKALTYIAENDKDPTIRKLAAWSIKTLTPESFTKMSKERVSKFNPDQK